MIASILLMGCINQDDQGGLVPINKTASCSSPYILSGGSCCLDMDGNGLCDSAEQTPGETTSSQPSGTREEATTTTIQNTCTDGIQNGEETGVDCGGSCKACRNMCEALINTTGIKPAARTTMLCLSSREQTHYAGYDLSIMNSDEGLTIGGYDANGSLKSTMLKDDKDMSIGQIAFRPIGRARKNATTYVWLYAWVPEDGVACSVNSDCGNSEVTAYTCIDNKAIIRQYYSYKCIQPGTIFSECRAQQNQEQVKICTEGYRCSSGDDRCFPKECFDGVQTKDEDDVDCGGSCMPCHCMNGIRDIEELGIDCEGGCRPCLGEYDRDTTAPKVKIVAPADTLYAGQRIELNYALDEPVEWCGYSVNGRPNITIMRNGTLYADEGINRVDLYCRDPAGNVGVASQSFTVYVKDTMACPKDNTTVSYSDHFDSVEFYVDTERELGVAEKCNQKIFDYALTYVNDSGMHYKAYDVSNDSSDGNLSALVHFLGYDCRASGDLEASYVVLKKDAQVRTYSAAKAVLYFSQRSPGNVEGAFWRIYSYDRSGDMPGTGGYMDVPYAPAGSNCGTEDNVLYQEFDLSGLLAGSRDPIYLRFGFYSQSPNQGTAISEAELFIESSQRA